MTIHLKGKETLKVISYAEFENLKRKDPNINIKYATKKPTFKAPTIKKIESEK